MPDHGDIVLIPIPFTDLFSQKRRPVIIISNDDYNQRGSDMVVVAMTSTAPRSPYSFTITSTDLERGRLNRPGTVSVDKIYTLDQKLAIKTFGRVSTVILHQIQTMLQQLTVPDSSNEPG